MPAVSEQKAFNPYIARFSSELERALHQELLSRFSEIPPEARPWYAVGITVQIRGLPPKTLGFLIVAPTRVILAHVAGVSNVEAGIVHGSPNAKEWWIETPDKKVFQIGETHLSPFDQAKQALHFVLPKLDGFLHAKKIRNPYVQSVLVFPDGYEFAGIQDVPIGPAARGAITLVKFSDVCQIALSAPQEERLDSAVFREWLRSLLPSGNDATFHFTWIEPAPPQKQSTQMATEGPAKAAQVPPLKPEVITLTREAEWSLDERSKAGPLEFDPTEVTLPRRDSLPFSSRQERPTSKRRMATIWKIAGGVALVLLVVFIARELYLYYKPEFPLTPYWQETAPSQPEQRSHSARQTPPVTARPEGERAPSPEGTDSSVSQAPATREPMPIPEKQAEQPLPAPSTSESSRPPSPPVRTLETDGPRRPAPPGGYETIRATTAFERPDGSAPVVDRLQAGTRLNVTGSDGEWLIVRSRTRNRTLYVKREDAMMLPDQAMQTRAAERREMKWKEIELQIQEAILKRGVPNVKVSFIGDTAYLRGNVRSAAESQAAEFAAKTIPEVQYVHNGIWVQP